MSESFALRIAMLAVGGAAGTVARYLVSVWVIRKDWADTFPWHTFGINVLGSFVLGFAAVLCQSRPGWLLLVGTGFCGGFTTFSTFSFEALALLEKDRPGAAAGYVLGSVVAGVIGVWAGVKLAGGRG